MANFFPGIKPDELLYSAFCRYHAMRGCLSHEKTTRELTGVRNCYISRGMPSRLGELCKALPGGGAVDPGVLVERYTLFPYYRPFLPKERAEQIRLDMIGNAKSGQIAARLGLIGCRLPVQANLRCCPKCMAEDEREYGFAYWHRTHQTNGVRVCWKHRCPLMETTASFHQRVLSSGYFPLHEKLITVPSVHGSMSRTDLSQLIWLAEKTQWLLVNQIDPVGPLEINKRFLYYMGKMGLTTLNNNFNQQLIRDRFASFYSKEILELLNCGLDPVRHGHDWLSEQLRVKNKTTNPLLYLLIIQCFGIDIEEFLCKECEIGKPFSDGPYPCLNPAAEHYLQDVVRICVVSKYAAGSNPVAKFHCECGFSYSREGPEKSSEDRYKLRRVIQCGPVWDAKLSELSAREDLTKTEIALRLNADRTTIRRHLEKIKTKEMENLDHTFVNTRDKKREELLNYIEMNKNMSRTEIAEHKKSLIVWMRKNDNEWLHKNFPVKRTVTGQPMYRKDWRKIDRDLAPKVSEIVAEIRKHKPKARISKCLIMETMNKRSYIGQLDKLPKLRNEIERYTGK